MLIRELTAEHIYLACGHTDMRKSIDGLAALVVSRFHLDPHQPALFLFCGRRKNRIKGLLWDETGFLLRYKRLEDGKYQWPDEPKDVLSWYRSTSSPCRSTDRNGSGKRSASHFRVQRWPTGSSGPPRTGSCHLTCLATAAETPRAGCHSCR